MPEPRQGRLAPPDKLRVPGYLVQNKDGLWLAEYNRFRLRSVFQPIYRRINPRTLRLEGFEGRIRAVAGGRECPPDDVFASVAPPGRFVLGRICRAIHLRNFALTGGGDRRIFVLMEQMTHAQLLDSAYDFQATAKRLGRFGLKPEQLVIEIIHASGGSLSALGAMAENMRAMGLNIAFGEFGSAATSVEAVVALKPDYVKLDTALLREATRCEEMAELVRALAHRAATSGIAVIADGIETRAELDFALSTGATLFQGALLGPRVPRIGVPAEQLQVGEIG